MLEAWQAGGVLTPPSHPLERLPEEWAQVLEAWGEPRYRGKQVFRWIHHRGVLDPAQMSDLPKSLREKLASEPLMPSLTIREALDAEDGTRKLALTLGDGRAIESVLIPMQSGGGDPWAELDADPDDEDEPEGAERSKGSSWVTQCISSQVGCAMGCVFCASGLAGLKRHLSAAEIVAQVILGRASLGDRGRVRNVVFMGMGEPLHNYDAVARALVLLCHPDGIGLSKRRVTVSTSGLVTEIDRLGREFDGQVALAVSLHQPDDAKRSELMPINKKYPLPVLMEALRRYPMPKRRRITIEYTLIEGVNAAVSDAQKLGQLLRGVRAKVNLIPLNRVEGTPLDPPSWAEVDAFQEELRRHNIPSFVRRRKGDDIAAACGQLALHGEARKVRVKLPVRSS